MLMDKRVKCLKCILLAAAWGIFQALVNFLYGGEIDLGSIVSYLGFSDFQILTESITESFSKMFVHMLFIFSFGTCIYEQFCYVSVYYFIRNQHKRKWLLKQSIFLFFCAVLYQVSYTAAVVGGTAYFNQLLISETTVKLTVYYVLLNILWLFLLAFVMNILAIFFNSKTAFLLVAGFEIFQMSILLLWDGVIYVGKTAVYTNLFSNLVLSWHESADQQLNRWQTDYLINNMITVDFAGSIPFLFSMLLFLGLAMILVAAGCILFEKYDLIVTNKETGGDW